MKNRIGFIEAVSTSERKGIAKSNVGWARFKANWGIDGDAHAGEWHRQVSLLAFVSIQQMRKLGAEVDPGDFAENLTVGGMDLSDLQIGDRLTVGEVILEITQIGKECHSRCAIYHQVGTCVMPVEGLFAKVVRGGIVVPGMQIRQETDLAA